MAKIFTDIKKGRAKHRLAYYKYLGTPESGTRTRNNYSFNDYCDDNKLEKFKTKEK